MKTLSFRTAWMVYKPAALAIFLMVWNALIVGSVVLTIQGFGSKRLSVFGAGLATAFMACFAAAPLLSSRIRQCCCRSDYDFGSARSGLIFLTVFASMGSLGLLMAFLILTQQA